MAYETFEFEHNGYTVKIIQDDEPGAGDPRDADNVGIMLARLHRNYTLGDRPFNRSSPAEWDEITREHDSLLLEGCGSFREFAERFEAYLRETHGTTVVLPLWLLDHSGLSMSTSQSPSDPQGWDSGIAGFIFDTAKTRETTCCPPDQVEVVLRSEVEEYDKYLRGDVWGYRILTPDGEEVDACWGFLGLDCARESAEEAVPDEKATTYTTATVSLDREKVTIQSIHSLEGWVETRGAEELRGAVEVILAALNASGEVTITTKVAKTE